MYNVRGGRNAAKLAAGKMYRISEAASLHLLKLYTRDERFHEPLLSILQYAAVHLYYTYSLILCSHLASEAYSRGPIVLSRRDSHGKFLQVDACKMLAVAQGNYVFTLTCHRIVDRYP